jgi:hypothetical protein
MNSLYILLVLGLLLHLSSTAVVARQFSSQCDVCGVTSPRNILPRRKEVNSGDLKNISHYFKMGQLKCLKLLNTSTGLISIQKQFLSHYGVLFVEFGPQNCPTFSKCWFGVLSCGKLKQQSFLQEYDEALKQNRSKELEYSVPLPSRERPKFLGWTMQSLNLQFRVVGPEILFPEVVYDRLNNILLCFYTLTLPGSYRMQIIPREFYPGMLFGYTKEQRIEGYHLLVSKPLFPERPQIISLPLNSSPFFCDSTSRQRIKT